MYIPYEEFSKFICLFLSRKNRDSFENWSNEKKLEQNLNYIASNKKKLLPKLKNKNTLRVVFYIYDETKWKCDSIYKEMKRSTKFDPIVVVTKNDCKQKDNPNYQTKEDVKRCYNFFKERCYRVELGYDLHLNRFIPFKKFKPDVIIYQHPWYVERTQGPVVCSKFALTCYVPYYIPTTSTEIDYYLRFHQYVERYYVFDEYTQKTYQKNMSNGGRNVVVTGQPFLDYYLENKSENKKYVIYAPHWSICKQGIAYGTFEWNGEFMLRYAHRHPEYNWIFKPHPLLYKSLIKNKLMTEGEARKYYNDWAKVGTTYDRGDYLKLFNQSQLMITDCSSFLGEFLLSESPVIHLVSEHAKPYNETIKRILKTYYRARNVEDLQYLIENIMIEDVMLKKRLQVIDELGLKETYAAENIINDIIKQIY